MSNAIIRSTTHFPALGLTLSAGTRLEMIQEMRLGDTHVKVRLPNGELTVIPACTVDIDRGLSAASMHFDGAHIG